MCAEAGIDLLNRRWQLEGLLISLHRFIEVTDGNHHFSDAAEILGRWFTRWECALLPRRNVADQEGKKCTSRLAPNLCGLPLQPRAIRPLPSPALRRPYCNSGRLQPLHFRPNVFL